MAGGYWSAASRAPMSPAHADDPGALFTWLGIIMYLPPASGPEAAKRAAVRAAFDAYQADWMAAVGNRYGAAEHWAKIEVPRTEAQLVAIRERLRSHYPVERFNAARSAMRPSSRLLTWHCAHAACPAPRRARRLELDPHNVLGNDLVDAVLPPHRVPLSS